jgi:hypothetical protein
MLKISLDRNLADFFSSFCFSVFSEINNVFACMFPKLETKRLQEGRAYS